MTKSKQNNDEYYMHPETARNSRFDTEETKRQAKKEKNNAGESTDKYREKH